MPIDPRFENGIVLPAFAADTSAAVLFAFIVEFIIVIVEFDIVMVEFDDVIVEFDVVASMLAVFVVVASASSRVTISAYKSNCTDGGTVFCRDRALTSSKDSLPAPSTPSSTLPLMKAVRSVNATSFLVGDGNHRKKPPRESE